MCDKNSKTHRKHLSLIEKFKVIIIVHKTALEIHVSVENVDFSKKGNNKGCEKTNVFV